MIYFSSDLHLFHSNIINHCNRPCTEEEHEEWIMNKFSHLKEGDVLYILGDLFYKRVRLQDFIKFFNYFKEKGVILYICLGNHDDPFENIIRQAYEEVFKRKSGPFVKHYFTLRQKDYDLPFPALILFHYPMESWNNSYRGSVHLHGHTHGNSSYRKNRYDVGLDVEHLVYSLDCILQKVKEDNKE